MLILCKMYGGFLQDKTATSKTHLANMMATEEAALLASAREMSQIRSKSLQHQNEQNQTSEEKD